MAHHSPSYSLTVRLSYSNDTGALGRITSVIGESDGLIGAVDIVDVREEGIVRDITINASGVDHGQEIVDKIRRVEGVNVLKVSDRTFLFHLGGKIEVNSKVPVKTRDDLSMAYTPGVARVCLSIADEPDNSFNLTIRRNTIAVVSDGSAVLGLGNIGPRAAMPVMEGKALLLKEFAGVDAFPLCIDTQDTEEIIRFCKQIEPTFGGINLEDISSPRCVEIEQRLEAELEIPVFHDDQHGTAIVVLAALMNALKVVDKEMASLRIVMNGAGAAGMAIAKLLNLVGVGDIILCDSKGAIARGRAENMNPVKDWLAENTNAEARTGSLSDVIKGADVFIGVSVADVLTVEDIQSMGERPIVFALANPVPEIDPDLAAPHAAVVATGRSDYFNQINNVLCFPGFFKGMLQVRAKDVTDEMKIAAAEAIARTIPEDAILPDYIVPSVFDRRVTAAVAEATAQAAIDSGTARRGRRDHDEEDISAAARTR